MKKYTVHDFVFENWSYKLVALFIALMLWLTILGRRDFVLSKNVEVEVLAGAGYVVSTQSVDSVRVKVAGPRMALKKFMDSGLSQQVTIDASRSSDGDYEFEIPEKKIDVPFGVKVLSVRPEIVRVSIRKSP